MCPTLLLQASKDSNAPPGSCAPLGPLSLHEHYRNLRVPNSTPRLHASIQVTLCCLQPNALLQDAKCPPSKQPSPSGHRVEHHQSYQEISNTLGKNTMQTLN